MLVSMKSKYPNVKYIEAGDALMADRFTMILSLKYHNFYVAEINKSETLKR